MYEIIDQLNCLPMHDNTKLPEIFKKSRDNLDSTGRKVGRIGYKTGKEMATYIYDILKKQNISHAFTCSNSLPVCQYTV